MSAKWIPCGQGTLNHPVSNAQISTEVVEQANWGRIFEVYHYNDDPEGTQCLITAAPDLLSALEEAYNAIAWDIPGGNLSDQEGEALLDVIRTALRKAKGE
jgi:hypothetical protein